MNTVKNPGKKLTHIAQMRVQFAYNQQLIRTELGLSETDYEMALFEAGCRLLERLFDRSTSYGSKWYDRLAKDNKYFFWKWFKAEYKVLENDLVNVLIGGGLALNEGVWVAFLAGIPHEAVMEKSFFHFMKSGR